MTVRSLVRRYRFTLAYIAVAGLGLILVAVSKGSLP